MNLKRILGFLAVGGLLVFATPTPQAQAASLINPRVAAATVNEGAGTLTTQVHWRGRGHHYGRRHHWHPRRHWHRRHHWHHRHHWRHRHWR
jgi:hypothetical protein